MVLSLLCCIVLSIPRNVDVSKDVGSAVSRLVSRFYHPPLENISVSRYWYCFCQCQLRCCLGQCHDRTANLSYFRLALSFSLAWITETTKENKFWSRGEEENA